MASMSGKRLWVRQGQIKFTLSGGQSVADEVVQGAVELPPGGRQRAAFDHIGVSRGSSAVKPGAEDASVGLGEQDGDASAGVSRYRWCLDVR